MKLALSNIAWDLEHDEAVAAVMREHDIAGVEVAPTKVWPKPLAASDREIGAYRKTWESRGIQIVAMQALLFGRPELQLFGSDRQRREMLEYLGAIIRIGGLLGARALVFGSPRNRKRGKLPLAQAMELATAFFRRAGELAAGQGCILCIEPNPPAYACDFVLLVADGRELVRAVDHAGFGLHLDAAALTLNGEPLGPVFEQTGHPIQHFHASEPYLATLGCGATDHVRLAASLRGAMYANWVSLEMKPPAASGDLARAVALLRHTYGNSPANTPRDEEPGRQRLKT